MREGWIETTLGEVAEVIGGGTPSTNVPNYWGDDVVWLTPTEIVAIDGKTISDSIRKLSYEGLANSGAQILPKGSVILTSRASVGFVAISECELSTNQGFQSLVPGKKVLAYFLMYWIQNNRNEFESRAAGSTFKEISKTNVKSIKINLPPLPEQKRIVDLISSVDAYIDALEKLADNAKQSRSAVLHEMLSASGDSWNETTLGQLISLEYGKSLTESNRDGIGYPVYGSAGVVGMHSKPLVSDSPVIIVGRKGTAGAVYWCDSPCFIIDTAYFVSRKSDIDPKFLFHLLNSINLESVTAQTGVPGLNRDRAYSLKCLIPPQSEQKRIVDLISSMDDGISATEKLISNTKQLRSGLLSDLLSGEHEITESYDKVMGAA